MVLVGVEAWGESGGLDGAPEWKRRAGLGAASERRRRAGEKSEAAAEIPVNTD